MPPPRRAASSSASSASSSGSGLAGLEQVRARAAVQLGVEVVGRELGERRAELRMRRDAGERVALEPVARLAAASARRSPVGARASAGRQAGLRLARQVEPVGERGAAPPAARASRRSGSSTSRARTNAACRSGRALDLEPDAVEQIALGLAEPLLEAGGDVGRVGARRQRDDAHVESLRGRELHPAQRRRLAGRVGVEAELEPLSSAGASSLSCRSVSAVPIDATTGSSPAWRSASTSVLPSTTTARSCFAIAVRARSRP